MHANERARKTDRGNEREKERERERGRERVSGNPIVTGGIYFLFCRRIYIAAFCNFIAFVIR